MPLLSKKYEEMNFSKFKCRMVVLGNKWRNDHGIDTFSDMVHMDTLKILLVIGASAYWEICNVDVAEAFLTTVTKGTLHIYTGTTIRYYVDCHLSLALSISTSFIMKNKNHIYPIGPWQLVSYR